MLDINNQYFRSRNRALPQDSHTLWGSTRDLWTVVDTRLCTACVFVSLYLTHIYFRGDRMITFCNEISALCSRRMTHILPTCNVTQSACFMETFIIGIRTVQVLFSPVLVDVDYPVTCHDLHNKLSCTLLIRIIRRYPYGANHVV
jgi:hypothetical protein